MKIVLMVGVLLSTVAAQAAPISDLSLEVFKRVSTQEKNVCFSPYANVKSLDLLRKSISGENKKKLDQKLATEDLSALLPGDYTLETAARFFVDSSLKLNDDFASELKKDSNAEFEIVPFNRAPEEAAKKINDWSKAKTRGLIPEIVNQSELFGYRALIANSLYVKARWQGAVGPLATQQRKFGQVKVPFLIHAASERRYAKVDGVETVEIKMDSAGGLHFGIILPDAKTKFTNWKTGLTPSKISTWMSSLKPQQTRVFFPKFKIVGDHDLTPPLTALGLGSLFVLNDDFKKIVNEPLQVNKLKQNIHFIADEHGIEGAAVQSMAMVGGGMPPHAIDMIVDRPFLFYLGTAENKQILFIGQYVSAK